MPALARALEARRDAINARFRVHRLARPRLDAPAALEVLAGTIGPIAEAVERTDPGATAGVVEAVADVAFALVGRNLLGPAARSSAIGQGWTALLALRPERLVEDPVRLARAISNAIATLDRAPGARPLEWIASMTDLAGRARSLTEWLEAGKVAAWRSGLPHSRASALAVASTLPPGLAAAALGAPALDREAARDALVERLRTDPWADPATGSDAPRSIRVVAIAGGFRGLGGPFLAPPRIGLAEGDLVATDGRASFALHADRFGVAFLPVEVRPGRRQGRGDPSLDARGRVRWAGETAVLPRLARATSWACDGRTLAATHERTHRVLLVAIAAGATVA